MTNEFLSSIGSVPWTASKASEQKPGLSPALDVGNSGGQKLTIP